MLLSRDSDDKVALVIHPELHFFRVYQTRPPSPSPDNNIVVLLDGRHPGESIGPLILSELNLGLWRTIHREWDLAGS